jgi:NAD-dependent deacetylase
MMIPDTLVKRLQQAQHIVIFTGAGMSAQSGIATFRDPDSSGMWGRYNPADVATPQAFKANPQGVWDWYTARAEGIRNAEPNAGHHAIAELSRQKRVTVVTQNVDGLHQRSGVDDVLELHGNILRLKGFQDHDAIGDGVAAIMCPVCCALAPSDSVDDAYASPDDLKKFQLLAGAVPRCPCCNVLLRPDVVMFGEQLDPAVLDAAVAAVESCDAVFCVGASLEVEPAASLPFMALNCGSVIVEVNPHQTALSQLADLYVAGGAAQVLPDLFKQIWGAKT